MMNSKKESIRILRRKSRLKKMPLTRRCIKEGKEASIEAWANLWKRASGNKMMMITLILPTFLNILMMTKTLTILLKNKNFYSYYLIFKWWVYYAHFRKVWIKIIFNKLIIQSVEQSSQSLVRTEKRLMWDCFDRIDSISLIWKTTQFHCPQKQGYINLSQNHSNCSRKILD